MLLVCVNTYNVKRNVSKIDFWVRCRSLVAEVLMHLACAVFPQGCWFVSWCSQKSTRVFVWMLTAGLFMVSKDATLQWAKGQTSGAVYSYNGMYYSAIKGVSCQATVKCGVALNPCC